jgi:hypothetical protein
MMTQASVLAQVSSVDFRRIWLDKDSKDPSREGIGIWRPVPPSGYYALGGWPTARPKVTTPAELTSSHNKSLMGLPTMRR